MNDRRRINPPSGGTAPPVYASTSSEDRAHSSRLSRTRRPDELRKIFLKTGLTPTASGSAYLELAATQPASQRSFFWQQTSSLKLSCAVHGPHPLPRSSPYNSSLSLSASIKFAPFATRNRRGYIRDSTERDLAVHLETALKGVIIGERWPKSGVDVIITVLEGEEDASAGSESSGDGAGVNGCGMMNVLAGCITAASAALVDAGIDCVDLIAGGVAATAQIGSKVVTIVDPVPAEHPHLEAVCAVAYLTQRDEITELWIKGDVGSVTDTLLNKAVEAATASQTVLTDSLLEGMKKGPTSVKSTEDVVMT